MQGESDGWYCAARREITRATSEGSSRSRGRAALAELRKQESPTGLPGVSADVAWRADGIWKARRGCFGVLQGGPRRGRSPITGPALQHAAQAAKITNKEKALAHAGRQNSHPKGQAFSLSIPADHAILPAARRPTTTAEASLMSGNRRFPSHTHAQDPKP